MQPERKPTERTIIVVSGNLSERSAGTLGRISASPRSAHVNRLIKPRPIGHGSDSVCSSRGGKRVATTHLLPYFTPIKETVTRSRDGG